MLDLWPARSGEQAVVTGPRLIRPTWAGTSPWVQATTVALLQRWIRHDLRTCRHRARISFGPPARTWFDLATSTVRCPDCAAARLLDLTGEQLTGRACDVCHGRGPLVLAALSYYTMPRHTLLAALCAACASAGPVMSS